MNINTTGLLLSLMMLTGALATPSSALAEWRIVSSVPTGDPLIDVTVDGDTIVAIGLHFDMSDMFNPELMPRAFRSTDGGDSFTPIHGNLQEGGLEPLEGVAVSGSTILIGQGERILRSTDMGLEWEEHSVGASLMNLAYIGDEEVVGIGRDGAVAISVDDGVTWSAGDSGTTIDLRGSMWRGQRGWAWGHDIERDAGPEGEDIVTDGVLIETRDGGGSWEELDSFSGVRVGPAWLGSGGLGFLGISTPDQPGSIESSLSVYRTDDGGESWHDLEMSTKVGTLEFGEMPWGFTGPMDIEADFIVLIGVEGEDVRLAAQALVIETSSNGDSQQDWRIVSFLSSDLGETWVADDLGTIEMDMMNPDLGDGFMVGGAMHDLHSGVMLSDDGRVFRLRTECEADADCFENYSCEEGECTRIPGTEPPDPGDEPGDEPGDGEDPGGGGNDNDFAVPPSDSDDDEDEDSPSCGCVSGGVDTMPGLFAALFLTLFFFVFVPARREK